MTYIIFDMEIRILNANNNKNIFYEVDNGETYESISKLFGVPVEYIKQNNVGSLYKGKILYLPESHFLCYIVKPFDTLQKIANQFNTTAEKLRIKNSLDNDYIFIGQKIYI